MCINQEEAYNRAKYITYQYLFNRVYSCSDNWTDLMVEDAVLDRVRGEGTITCNNYYQVW